MNLKYNKGTKLMIELCGGKVYEGEFVYNTDTQISLTNVSEYPSIIKMSQVFHFYITEIESLKALDGNDTTKENEVEGTPLKSVNFDRIKELAHKNRCLSQIDARFYTAIEYLKTVSVIYVMGFGCLQGRFSNIEILGIGSKYDIILFDIKILNKKLFDLGFKHILESECITKCVHNSKELNYFLKNNYNVTLKNVFDVQIVDYMLSQKATGVFPDTMRSFPDCISTYLNISLNVVQKSVTNEEELSERPLSDDTKLNISIEICYLSELHTVLMNRLLLNLNKTTECYLNCMENDNDVSLNLNSNVPEKVKQLNLTL